MTDVTIKQLLEAGVHFGHQTQRWNPKMKKYIFGERNGIYIINLEITLECVKRAGQFVEEIARQGKDLLFVGTKRQAQEPIREAAETCGMPFVNQRWLGGMLTNFETIRKSLGRIEAIDRMEQDGSFQFMTKKEVNTLKKEREKLNKNLSGIRTMKRLPGAIFVIDAKKEEIAIREANKLKVPVVSVLDTNCDPDLVDYPLPGNDDAIRAIRLFCSLIAAAAKAGRDGYLKIAAAEEARKAEEAQKKSDQKNQARSRKEGSAGQGSPAEAAPSSPEESAEDEEGKRGEPQAESVQDASADEKAVRK